jgi:hypothetical protein
VANITLVRNILSAIKNSAHAISELDIAHQADLGQGMSRTRDVLAHLKAAGYIKADSRGAGYFTRTPKRNEIVSFINSTTNVLPGITFDTEASAPETPVTGVMGDTSARTQLIKSILKQISEAPGSMDGNNLVVPAGSTQEQLNHMVTKLSNTKVIKEHETKSDFWFTRKPMRTKIAGYLQGTVSEADLLNPEIKNLPEPVQVAVAPAAPTTHAVPTTVAVAPSICAPTASAPAPTEDKPKRKHVRTRPLAVASATETMSTRIIECTVRQIENGFLTSAWGGNERRGVYTETLNGVEDIIGKMMAE